MKFFPVLQDLYASLETAGYAFSSLIQGQIDEVNRMINEQIAQVMYGMDTYNDELNKLGGTTENLANVTEGATNSMVNSWNQVTDASNTAKDALSDAISTISTWIGIRSKNNGSGSTTTTEEEPSEAPTEAPTEPVLKVASVGQVVQDVSGASYAWWKKISDNYKSLRDWRREGYWFGGDKAGSVKAAGYSYEHGTSYVPKTGLALLHKGEAVIPANQNTTNNKSYSPSIVVNVSGDGNAADIKRAVEQALSESARQYNRRGFELIPGMS